MQDYEYKDGGGRILCTLHHRLRCDECHYVSELRDENRRYRETAKSAIEELEYVLNSRKSKDVKQFYIENTIRILNRSLEDYSK